MREPITLFVEGDPKGQPRPRGIRRGDRAGVYDPRTADGWKACVAEVYRHVTKTTPVDAFTGAVTVSLTFWMRRPKGHFNSKGNLRPSAPARHTKKPDVDNLAKAVLDELTRLGMWHDDSQIDTITIRRMWATGLPGVTIRIRESDP